ncbi:uncharacterized protein LOC125875239 [Solanum stenotomum]|uniref:uncharacterized protein LOC125875239 n=1 Tax=Solanum stenotomum TaxID=172797 RepID=UPI0020D1AB85|nr:uncharacterized protein LOC125875239 [Solanum stenotomum]
MIASYSLKDLMRVKLSSKVLNQVANEPSVYQKVTLVSIPEFIWSCSVVRKCTSFLEMCRALRSLEALYRKCMYDFFNHSNSNGLRMINQEADGDHIGASYVLDIISIFNDGGLMTECMGSSDPPPFKKER